MIKYYSWAVAEKILSYTPFGGNIYYGLGKLLQKNIKGRSGPMISAINLVKKGMSLIKDGGTILDVGTGWYHHEPFLFYLIGNYKQYLFDVMDKATILYIQNYLLGIKDNIDFISSELQIDKEKSLEKINYLLNLKTREEIYKECNFTPIISKKTDELFLPENSVDLMISNCVVNHIPQKILIPELAILRKILKKNGRMHFLLGHDDHWTFHDPSMNMFQYYKYSDLYYKIIFETSFQFQNRLVKSEWLEIFKKVDLLVDDYHEHITDKSRSEIKKLSSKLDKRFAKYSEDELAIIHSYVTLKK